MVAFAGGETRGRLGLDLVFDMDVDRDMDSSSSLKAEEAILAEARVDY